VRVSLALLSALLLSTCPVLAADIAITAFPAHGEKATNSDIDAAQKLATATPGITSYFFAATWDEIATEDSKRINDLKIAAYYGGQTSLPAYLGIQTINTTERGLPSRFRKARWTKTEMLLEFDEFLRGLVPTTGQNVRWLSLGNEADVYLAEHPDELEDYLSFYKKATISARRVFPSAKIGITVTYDGLTGERSAIAGKLIAASDAVFITYYPVKFTVKSPEIIDKELTDLQAMFPEKQIIFQEIGFPSSPKLNSSETIQSAFFETTLPKLKASPAVGFINLFALHDFSPSVCRALQSQYNNKSEFFRDYLCTLGFFTTSGKPKKSWKSIETALHPVDTSSPEKKKKD